MANLLNKLFDFNSELKIRKIADQVEVRDSQNGTADDRLQAKTDEFKNAMLMANI